MLEGRRVLFVEDDQSEIESISSLLRHMRLQFVHSRTVSDAVKEIVMHPYDYVLTDLHIESKAGTETPDGLIVVRAAKEQQPNITIVATSSDPRTEVVESALTAGAHHFVRKPLAKVDEIEIAFKLGDQRRRLRKSADEVSRPKRPSGHWDFYSKNYPYGIIQGDYESKIARLAAKKRASCIITGETGTGKEEAAKLIHRFRTIEEGPIPFVAVNCATITGNLAESLLFGHKKGAFTGADEATTGYIAEADGGILFLDEIQTLSIPVQQKLLRVLNDGSYQRLGETRTQISKFQLVAATTKDLSREVEEGRFLVDIQMRMMGIEIFIPPLRERLADIAAFLALFLSRRGITLKEDLFEAISEKLKSYRWPGNIRQLFKCLEAWLLYCELDGVPMSPENFPTFRDLPPMMEQPTESPRIDSGIDFNVALRKDYDFETIISEYERTYLAFALDRHKSISECCKAINLPRSTLDAKRRKHNLI